MNTPFDVLVIGELNVDLILNQIDALPEVGKEKWAKEMALVLGSSSAIFAANLAAMGAKVAFAGAVGQDLFGDFVLDQLQKKNINTDHVVQVPHTATGATVVMNYGTDRANLTHAGAMALFSAENLRPEVWKLAKHLHVSSVFMQENLKPNLLQILEKAKDSGMTTSLDPQWDPAEQWELDLTTLLPKIDLFLPNTEEAKNLTQSTDIYRALGAMTTGHWIAIKNGDQGAILKTQERIIEQKAYLNPDVVDCIGAGDSFDAGFVFQFIQNKPPAECLDFAVICGAVNTTSTGGTMAFSSLEDILKIAQNRFSYKAP